MGKNSFAEEINLDTVGMEKSVEKNISISYVLKELVRFSIVKKDIPKFVHSRGTMGTVNLQNIVDSTMTNPKRLLLLMRKF